MLGQRVGSHAGYQHMQSRTQHRDEQRVEQITGQRHPHVRQDAEHLAVVVHHRTAHIERGRETEDLLNGLQGLNDRVIQRERHEGRQQEDEQEQQNTARLGAALLHANPSLAVKEPALGYLFHLDSFPAHHVPTLLSILVTSARTPCISSTSTTLMAQA